MKLLDYLKEKTLLLDGAMGTYYQQLKGQREEISELANSSDREQVLNIHKEYLMAGANIIRTNTFAINSVVLSEISKEEREQLPLPGFMVGIDFRELTAYIRGYMESMPVNEYLNGLISYEIVSFAEDKVVLRKTYDETRVENQFYVCRRGEFVVVYNSADYTKLEIVYPAGISYDNSTFYTLSNLKNKMEE